MQFLQTAFKNFTVVGIDRGLHIFNARSLATLAFYWLSIISAFVFLFYEASDFRQYIRSIFVAFSATTISIVFTIILIKKKRIFELTDLSDEFTDSSELK